MKRAVALLFALGTLAAAQRPLRAPLWVDRDDREIPEPAERRASELYAIVYNSWLRHLSPEYHADAARDRGALDVNAWDEVPDSSWFTNRIGRRPLSFTEIAEGLPGRPPAPPPWTVVRIEVEGYTPKLRIADRTGQLYMLKFDPATVERNSGAERICTLIAYAAGYNVPHNSIVRFRAEDLRLTAKSQYRDVAGRRRPMTAADLEEGFRRLKPLGDGRYRGLASMFLAGRDVGQFVYTGSRKDDANDVIPHELRRELRGLRVIASWINHVDAGDKNTMNTWGGAGKFVRHHLIDFGSALGSGDFINGPYRVSHEYIFDGPAMGRAFFTLGIWRRPWEERGEVRYPEVGYFPMELFEPAKWKPNYPNLAFERMDDGDAYWGAKIVTAFSDELIARLAEAGEYSRAEVTAHLAATLAHRRDAIGRYWLERVSPLEDFTLDGNRLRFRDLAIERGYVEGGRRYRYSIGRTSGILNEPALEMNPVWPYRAAKPDRWGRTPLLRVHIEAARRDGGWALPVEVVLGYRAGGAELEVLGWEHAAR